MAPGRCVAELGAVKEKHGSFPAFLLPNPSATFTHLPMHLITSPTPDLASEAAADHLAAWLTDPATRNLMVAAGNTPLDCYRRVAARRLALEHLQVFVLDEYLGIPPDEPRNCSNLLRRAVAEAWHLPPGHFHALSPVPAGAPNAIRDHERRIAETGGLDVVVLGLGQNGHLGFNEPGSARDSVGRTLPLERISVEANRLWFEGRHAPDHGVTTGLATVLAARRVLLLAFGPHKTAAVRAMIRGPRTPACPASWLQDHPDVHVFLDVAAAAGLEAAEGT